MAENKDWSLDRRVPVAILITMLFQFGGFMYLFGQVENRVTHLESSMAAQTARLEAVTSEVPQRLARIEALLEGMRGSTDPR